MAVTVFCFILFFVGFYLHEESITDINQLGNHHIKHACLHQARILIAEYSGVITAFIIIYVLGEPIGLTVAVWLLPVMLLVGSLTTHMRARKYQKEIGELMDTLLWDDKEDVKALKKRAIKYQVGALVASIGMCFV